MARRIHFFAGLLATLTHEVSLSYLEHIFSKMRQQGLVEGTRGRGGGYSLSRPANAISVADIIGTVDNQSGWGELEVHRQDEPTTPVMTPDLWEALNSKMMAYMHSITLRNLAQEQLANGAQIENRRAVMRSNIAKRRKKSLKVTAPNSVFALADTLE